MEYPVDLVPGADLRPYANNARTHSQQQLDQIKELIRLVGFTNPALVDLDDDKMIIAGHGRLLALQQMWEAGETVMGPGKRNPIPDGMIPIIDGSGMSEAERRAFIIADNQVATNSDWDKKLLTGELFALKGMDFDLGVLGFEDHKLVSFMATDHTGDPDRVPEPPKRAKTRRGDIWELGQHRVMCGDATDAEMVAKLLSGRDPFLMATDPPYGVNYDPDWRSGLDDIERATGTVDNDDNADWRAAYALFPGDVAYVWHSGLFCGLVEDGLRSAGLILRQQIIWNKPHYAIGRSNYHPKHEPLFYAVRKGKRSGWQGGRKQSTVWDIDNGTFQGGKREEHDAKTGHGTQKPVECMQRPIENNTLPGQQVYDPFLGSGTTLIAAERTARICLAMELNPLYVDIAVQRWCDFTGQEARNQRRSVIRPSK